MESNFLKAQFELKLASSPDKFRNNLIHYAQGHAELATYALYMLWNEENENLFKDLRHWYDQKKSLAVRAHAVEDVLKLEQFKSLLLVALMETIGCEFPTSPEQDAECDDIVRIMKDSDAVVRLFEQMKDSPGKMIWVTRTRFPESYLESFKQFVGQWPLMWEECKGVDDQNWWVFEVGERAADDPFVYVQITGSTWALGLFILATFNEELWCTGLLEELRALWGEGEMQAFLKFVEQHGPV